MLVRSECGQSGRGHACIDAKAGAAIGDTRVRDSVVAYPVTGQLIAHVIAFAQDR